MAMIYHGLLHGSLVLYFTVTGTAQGETNSGIAPLAGATEHEDNARSYYY